MKSQIFVIYYLVLLLAGCSTSGNYAPVVDREKGRFQSGKTHVVRKGETLYSIAWLYGIEYRKLAATNGVAAPYTIYPGQKLLLLRNGKVTHGTTKTIASTPTKPQSRLSKKPKPEPNPVAKTVTKPAESQPVSSGSWRWQWPAQGKVTQGFRQSAPAHKGIDIKGKLGEPVVAANSGTVVYAGSGLVGYGRLLIVKHNEVYLSAYAHNSRLLVKEGQSVRAGEKIAEMGNTGTNTVKLHFEIRKNGKPVNPQSILPIK